MNVDPLLRLLEGLDPTPGLLAHPEPHPVPTTVEEWLAAFDEEVVPPPPPPVRPDPTMVRLLDPMAPPPDHPLLRDWPTS